jgi:hypothetical protein
MPFTTPSVSSIAFKIGVIAFVVQDAAEKYLFHQDCIRFGLHREQFGTPLPGAVNKTLSTPQVTTQGSLVVKAPCIIN